MKFIKLTLWIFSVTYLSILCILWASPYWPPKLYGLANLFQVSPLWVLAVPAIGLFIAALPVRSKAIIFINLASFFIIVFFIMGFNVPLTGLMHKGSDTKNNLRIISCNLSPVVNMRSLSEFILKKQPDIILFQEAYENHQSALKKILSQNKWELSFQGGLGIASGFKIKRFEVINRDMPGGGGNMAVRYDLERNMGNMHLFYVHLHTPRVGIQDIIDGDINGVSEIKDMAQVKDKESGIVSQWIAPYKNVLIAGDFNMSQRNPVYRKYWAWFTNVFSKAGFGFGYTKFTSWHGVRIDHILCDGGWKVIHSEVGPDVGSDHRPLVTDVEFIGNYAKDGRPTKAEGQAISDNGESAYIYPETYIEKLKNLGETSVTVDTDKVYEDKYSLKVEPKASVNQVNIKIEPDAWNIEKYPMVNFKYMIPIGTTLELRVKTAFNDWVYLGGTATNQLSNDGKWNEASIDIRSLVNNVLPGVNSLQEISFFSPDNTGAGSYFWIDMFKLVKQSGE